MLYILGKNFFEVYNGKNLNICRVPEKCTRQNELCRVPEKNTRWRLVFAECLTTGTRQTLTAVSRFDGWRPRRPRAQILPSAYPAALGKYILCQVLDFCRVLELGKSGMYRVRNLCRVSVNRHSANMMFAECPWFGTRQRNEHSAYMPFPVVVRGFMQDGADEADHWSTQRGSPCQ